MNNIYQIEDRLQNKIAAILEIPPEEVYLSFHLANWDLIL